MASFRPTTSSSSRRIGSRFFSTYAGISASGRGELEPRRRHDALLARMLEPRRSTVRHEQVVALTNKIESMKNTMAVIPTSFLKVVGFFGQLFSRRNEQQHADNGLSSGFAVDASESNFSSAAFKNWCDAGQLQQGAENAYRILLEKYYRRDVEDAIDLVVPELERRCFDRVSLPLELVGFAQDLADEEGRKLLRERGGKSAGVVDAMSAEQRGHQGEGTSSSGTSADVLAGKTVLTDIGEGGSSVSAVSSSSANTAAAGDKTLEESTCSGPTSARPRALQDVVVLANDETPSSTDVDARLDLIASLLEAAPPKKSSCSSEGGVTTKLATDYLSAQQFDFQTSISFEDLGGPPLIERIRKLSTKGGKTDIFGRDEQVNAMYDRAQSTAEDPLHLDFVGVAVCRKTGAERTDKLRLTVKFNFTEGIVGDWRFSQFRSIENSRHRLSP